MSSRMVDQDKKDKWDEVLEEADKLVGVHKDPVGTPISSGTNRRSKSEKKPRFSLRGYTFAPLDAKTENLCIGGQEDTSGQPKTKALETVMDERLENIEEEAEDLQPEFSFATHNVNTSVSELLEDLQGRSGSSVTVRTPVLLHKHAPDTAIRDQEVSSELPQTKASQTKMAELGNAKGETEELPSELAPRTKKSNISVAELLEDLQGRSGSSLRTAALHQPAPYAAIKEQKVSFGVPPTKASETLMTEMLGNTNEDTEDVLSEFAQPTKKANTSVAKLLEDLQRRSSSSVRTATLQRALDTAIREQEVSSGLPPTKASGTLMAELLANTKEDTEDVPSESARPTKKANISVAELLEDLQGRSGSSVQHPRAKDHKPKLSTSGKKTLAILDERSHDSDDPLEHAIDGTSSEEEEVIQNYLALVNKDVKQQSMTDLFQEIFNPANMEGTTLLVRSTGAGYCRRMQRIMQLEKDRHADFLRQYNREQGGSKGITVKIMSRSLEGKLSVCSCLFQESSNLTLTSNASTDQAKDENRTKMTIIFSPKICDNVDLLVGNMVHIFPPWKEVRVQEENVILCTYFSHHGHNDT